MKKIAINSSIEDRVPYHKIKVLQGEMKDLTGDNYQKLKSNILKYGFTSPLHIWVNENGDMYSLDGVQRLRTLQGLENEGFIIDDVPVTRITAATEKDAKKILLSLASQYGTFNDQGLFEFVHDLGFGTLKDVADEFSLPTVDFDSIGDQFLKDSTDKKPKAPKVCKHCGEEI